MDLGIEDMRAVVTGGSSGIGLATADLLLAEGAHVVICGRNPERLDAAVRRLEEHRGQGRVHGVAADVGDERQLAQLFQAAQGRLGGLDVLVNNAGSSRRAGLGELSRADWVDDYTTKVLAQAEAVRHAVPLMRARGGGAVVNVTSISGKAPPRGTLPTSASRAAGIALTVTLARDLAPDGIRVNALCLGAVESDQHRRRYEQEGITAERYYARLAEQREIPLGRAGRAAEAAACIVFLASPAASFVTGAALNVDGGQSPVG